MVLGFLDATPFLWLNVEVWKFVCIDAKIYFFNN